MCCATVLHATDLYPPEETVAEDGDEANADVSDTEKIETDTPDDGSEEPEVDAEVSDTEKNGTDTPDDDSNEPEADEADAV